MKKKNMDHGLGPWTLLQECKLDDSLLLEMVSSTLKIIVGNKGLLLLATWKEEKTNN